MARLHAIGEDRSEMLDYVPAQTRVQVIRRLLYGCRTCEGAVVQAPAPERLLGRLSGRSTLAQAIRYALNHWTGLIRFLDDGRFELDATS